MNFLPLKPSRTAFYVNKLYDSMRSDGRLTPRLAHAKEVLDDASSNDQSPDNTAQFWFIVKTSIEYVIDYMTFDATASEFDEQVLSRAYEDMATLIKYAEIAFGVQWSPQLISE